MATALREVVERLTYGLAIDLTPVRVNAMCSGLVLTDQVNKMPEATLELIVAPLPLLCSGSPAEAAKAYIYLMLNS